MPLPKTSPAVGPLGLGTSFPCYNGSARTAVGYSLSLARWPLAGLMSCATPPSTQQLADDF